MNISGGDLRGLIPEEMVFSLDSIQFIPNKGDTEPYVMLTLVNAQGSMNMAVYRRDLAKLIGKNPTALKLPKPGATPLSAGSAMPSEDSTREYFIGKTRVNDGVRERLVGFTATSSPRVQPKNVSRRIRHPETGGLVWPLWEAIPP